jgi:adenylate kinase family enzyme
MASRLIIIRGNSGSGKSTVAKKLRDKLGDNTMLIPQDVIRKLILGVKDRESNPAVQLIHDIALYGKTIGFDVVLEGILNNKIYREMLNELLESFNGNVYAYYFDVPFEETIKRHGTKSPEIGFGEKEMRSWWHDKDYLSVNREIIIDESLKEDDVVEMIYKQVKNKEINL